MREIVWTRAAEADLQKVYEDLEGFHESSGESFLLLVDASIQLLRQFPEMAPMFQAPLRRLLLNGEGTAFFMPLKIEGLFCTLWLTSGEIRTS